MTRELLIESVWQALCFTIPIKRTDYHLFMHTFLEGNKRFAIQSVEMEALGTIEESLFDFIITIEHKKYEWMQERAQEQLNVIADLGRKANDMDRKSGKFREIKFGDNPPDYGLNTGDIIEGWVNII